jgi:aldose sugar dehydrogenase
MKIFHVALLIISQCIYANAQNFSRTELPTVISNPWEMTMGPDGKTLWLSEPNGVVSKVSLSESDYGARTIVHSAPDYFDGDTSEKLHSCFQPPIGSGTLGLAVNLKSSTKDTLQIFYVYSFNAGTSLKPQTYFKVMRLDYDLILNKVVATKEVLRYKSGFWHLGGRLMIAKQNNTPYLFLSVGDYSPSEISTPECFVDKTKDIGNYTQEPTTINGKIHRFHLDGSIPNDNPIPGNSFYTRGHRNPQGLMFNPKKEILYDSEHGDMTDDEINILVPGMNYGWRNIRGYHDGNFQGEMDFVNSYIPDSRIANDKLMPSLYSWCADTLPNILNDTKTWCTVAPSDGIYYGATAIPEWTNSLLVVTLKNADFTDQELFQFKLTEDGKNLAAVTATEPNPKKFFGEDQSLNGRLRDIEVSKDGKDIYILTNDFILPDKIVRYSYIDPNGLDSESKINTLINISPNPTSDYITIQSVEQIESIEMLSSYNTKIVVDNSKLPTLNISNLSNGIYMLNIKMKNGKSLTKKIVKL